MSTRSRTRSATAASLASSSTVQPPSPTSTRPRKGQKTHEEGAIAEEGRVTQIEENENDTKVTLEAEASASTSGRNVKRKVLVNGKAHKPKTSSKAYCTCRGQDDGSPMVLCSSCDEWYHFKCVQLNERDAEDIRMFICPPCSEKTGYHSIMEWEGPEALEEVKADLKFSASEAKSARTNGSSRKGQGASEMVGTVTKKPVGLDIPSSESDGDPDSEDDYISDSVKERRGAGKRRIRRVDSDESDISTSDEEQTGGRGRSRRTSSPALKRKRLAAREPPTKRRRSASGSPASDDPTRKYCLGKLAELFSKVFLKYPYILSDGKFVEKKPEDLTGDEKQKLEENAKEFATGLEQCVYEIYSEPDKSGDPHAGAKYKDRFRMLQFNLGKDDRVVIHKRIASSQITPKEISTMSSTDLANEETKQSIKMLEQEALEHSILQKVSVPRAKITHKGLQDIEDVNGTLASMRERDRELEREHEEEERIERERVARLRTQRQRTQSMSVPPESPTTAPGSWGGPPPLPLHALAPVPAGGQISTPTTDAAGTNAEPELNLADLINIDDDLQVATTEPHALEGPTTNPAELQSPEAPAEPLPNISTGISPFSTNAPHPVPQRQPSFDLNAVWSAPKGDAEIPATTTPPGSPPAHLHPALTDVKDSIAEVEANEAEDHDFDMFLDEPDPGTSSVPPAPQNTFDSLPNVWHGKVSMPLDSTIPQETPVVARQIGGRTLAPDSLLWKTLFPSDILRIEGRVPIDKSAEYLLQMRMNAGKELIAAAFSPASEQDAAHLQIISDFLISKGRHGLIFPWGHRPKDYHPGRELYIIPLLSSDPLPDYIDMLDSLCLPKLRTANLLIGIWILHKGKLTPPPSIPPSQPTPQISTSMATLNMNSPVLPTPTFPAISPVASVAPQIEPSVLAAEVASLTPEQVQMMLRTLTSGSAVPIPVASAVPPLVPPVPPPVPQTAPANQQWPNASYGAFQQNDGPSGYPPYGPPGHRDRGYEQRPYEDDRRSSTDRGERGWRGRNRGRGRGRRDDDFSRRPSDSGWPRQRGRNNDFRDDRRREQWT